MIKISGHIEAEETGREGKCRKRERKVVDGGKGTDVHS